MQGAARAQHRGESSVVTGRHPRCCPDRSAGVNPVKLHELTTYTTVHTHKREFSLQSDFHTKLLLCSPVTTHLPGTANVTDHT